ncbi:hypothetical protein GGD83_004454 [Rhodoblastus sphagnicola]|uniref:hypothetical protein n=1 Tax=Rhodoblastus sphagnicola TaxID=333368 RepID=UPI0011B030F6|nr:hypothetical protein [Rhodoblastus sphagnicola]MBB4200625.1 hypothetical protein [Rhodoblastus sphagnicola]
MRALHAADVWLARYEPEVINVPVIAAWACGAKPDCGDFALGDGLRCPKPLINFTGAEGAEGHCKVMTRSLRNRCALDWLGAMLCVA